MKTQITFRHFNGHHPKLHQAAEELAAGFTKYNSNIISTNVEFINGTEKIVNFIVNIKERTLTSEFASDDFHKSLNAAADKIVKQLQKYKDKKNNDKAKVKESADDLEQNNFGEEDFDEE